MRLRESLTMLPQIIRASHHLSYACARRKESMSEIAVPKSAETEIGISGNSTNICMIMLTTVKRVTKIISLFAVVKRYLTGILFAKIIKFHLKIFAFVVE